MPKKEQPQLVPAFENLCCDWTSTKYKDRVRAAAHFCAERHMIYIRRREGQEAPWTRDPILRGSRFCNIYREIDRVTKEIMGEWVRPQLDNPNIACIALLGRIINFTPTLVALADAGIDYRSAPSAKKAFKVFNDIKARKEQLVTGAYIVNTKFPNGVEKVDGSKADYLANFLIPELWSHRANLAAALSKNSYEGMLAAFSEVHGVGRFIANQAACDLSYTRHLRSAKDLNEVWSPGPGTAKGIRIITNNDGLNPGPKMDEALTKYREDLNYELSHHRLWSDNMKDVHTNVVPLTNPNASNSLCELSKHAWMALGLRERLKNSYKAGEGK